MLPPEVRSATGFAPGRPPGLLRRALPAGRLAGLGDPQRDPTESPHAYRARSRAAWLMGRMVSFPRFTSHTR